MDITSNFPLAWQQRSRPISQLGVPLGSPAPEKKESLSPFPHYRSVGDSFTQDALWSRLLKVADVGMLQSLRCRHTALGFHCQQPL